MKNFKIIQETVDYVHEVLAGESSGHDWWHTRRVWKMARKIAIQEQANILVVELAALLHDIADWKSYDGDLSIGPKKARDWLKNFDLRDEDIDSVCQIIHDTSFKGAQTEEASLTLEGMIVQDADRLDAIGAIGIGRTFAYGGNKDRIMYDPEIEPVLHKTAESYFNNQGPTINHFYEKLLLLKDRMNTQYAREIATERHEFMEDFLSHFFDEWEGKQ
jgi:uncharacterized protein